MEQICVLNWLKILVKNSLCRIVFCLWCDIIATVAGVAGEKFNSVRAIFTMHGVKCYQKMLKNVKMSLGYA